MPLSTAKLPQSTAPELTARERLPVEIFADASVASAYVAREIAELIREKAAKGEPCVLGLATGSTPVGVYGELIRLHREEHLSFANVVTFNLDEYHPMEPGHLQSYHRFMKENLFDDIDIDPANIHIPDGTTDSKNVAAHCEAYEQAIRDAGGIDLQILGVGRTGHVGFNEPGSPKDSRTRLITLDKVTRMDAASDFFGEWNVPRRAMTMGVGTILDARRVVLIAFAEHKAPIVRRAVEEPITNSVAASFLQEHADAQFVLDPAAGAELTRCKTPWLLGQIERFALSWDTTTVRKAVVWLARTLDKPILKLTDQDYNEHGLQDLLTATSGAYDLNIRVFKGLSRTITGWPGGKPGRPRFVPGKGVSDDNGPDVFPKRIVVFSPHPDDDVISMGGTLIRLCDQGHEVHVAYQTSGNIAVFDDGAVRHVDFLSEVAGAFDLGENADRFEETIAGFVRAKKAGEPDSPELRTIKGLIRRTEARAAAKYSGVKEQHIHFQDLPFYETGAVKKRPIGDDDVRLTLELLDLIEPHEVYAAGDLSDPHGTHRVCLRAILLALDEAKELGREWRKSVRVWLYRGAWQEWSPEEIEMAVPLSPSEVDRKRLAIFKHESQKDRALFPGPADTREFWQRAEDRNRKTAELYDKLGLPEYQAIEGFVAWAE